MPTIVPVLLIVGPGIIGCTVDRARMADDLRLLRAGVREDHVNLYGTRQGWCALGAPLTVSAASAHTSFDQEFRDWYQEDVRSETTDDVADVFDAMGDGKYLIPLAVGSYLMGARWHNDTLVESPVGEWGERCMRSALLGAEGVLVLQGGLGGSRPGESADKGSRWQPFDDSNGVSGHAFMGAIPFLNAGYMCEEPWVRSLCWAGSTLPALARINDDAHYLSQSFLGWSIAVAACHAVNKTQMQASGGTDVLTMEPWATSDGSGLMLVWQR